MFLLFTYLHLVSFLFGGQVIHKIWLFLDNISLKLAARKKLDGIHTKSADALQDLAETFSFFFKCSLFLRVGKCPTMAILKAIKQPQLDHQKETNLEERHKRDISKRWCSHLLALARPLPLPLCLSIQSNGVTSKHADIDNQVLITRFCVPSRKFPAVTLHQIFRKQLWLYCFHESFLSFTKKKKVCMCCKQIR